jgi:hypothetical protein
MPVSFLVPLSIGFDLTFSRESRMAEIRNEMPLITKNILMSDIKNITPPIIGAKILENELMLCEYEVTFDTFSELKISGIKALRDILKKLSVTDKINRAMYINKTFVWLRLKHAYNPNTVIPFTRSL